MMKLPSIFLALVTGAEAQDLFLEPHTLAPPGGSAVASINASKTYTTRDADPFCKHGLVNEDVCCHASCGKCGGSGCSGMCCVSHVREEAPPCAISVAPCVLPDPTCKYGRKDEDDQVCCADTCDKCWGAGCSGMCCASHVKAKNYPCDVVGAPCVLAAHQLPIKQKRGFVGDGCRQCRYPGTDPAHCNCRDADLLDKMGWYYGYRTYDIYHAASEHQNFVPMHYCTDFSHPPPPWVNTTYMLSFNEPEGHGCNVSSGRDWVDIYHGTIYPQWPNTIHATPALSLNSGGLASTYKYMDDIVARCQELYGTSGCPGLKFINIHVYSCTVEETMTALDKVWQRWGLPIWITEMSCKTGASHRPTAQHFAYMTQIVPALDAAPHIFRYGWMAARDSNDNRNLVNDGSGNGEESITGLGRLWQAL